MTKKAVDSPNVHPRFGNYSVAIEKGNMLFISGMGPFDVNQKLVGKDDIKAQTHQTLQNIRQQAEDAGYSMDDIVRSTVYLNNIGDWAAFNEVYGEYFKQPWPARCVVGCQLNGFLVEIECTAIK
jgi:2-iminobutanoate/2-iminopropanoate deaminase